MSVPPFFPLKRRNKKSSRRRSRHKKLFTCLIGLVLVTLLLFLLADHSLRDVADPILQQTAARELLHLLEETAAKVMTDQPPLLSLTRNQEGSITDYRLDTARLQQIKSLLSREISALFAQKDPICVSLPLGSLTPFVFFSGKGPDLSFRLVPLGSPDLQLVSSFTSAGINQTLYSLVLEISLTLLTGFPLGSNKVDFSASILLCEQGIVGKTPGFLGSWKI